MHLVMKKKAQDMSQKFDSKAARESAANEIKTIEERLSFLRSEVLRLKNLMRSSDASASNPKLAMDDSSSSESRRNSDLNKDAPSKKSIGSSLNNLQVQEELGQEEVTGDGDPNNACRVINNINRRSSLGKNWIITFDIIVILHRFFEKGCGTY